MNREEAARLTRRAKALRAKAVYVSDTGERVPEAERKALESKAKELEDRVAQEYPTSGAGAFTFTTPPYVHGYRPPPAPPPPPPTPQDKSWVYNQGSDYLSSYFSGTVPDEIIEEGYEYDSEEGDW